MGKLIKANEDYFLEREWNSCRPKERFLGSSRTGESRCALRTRNKNIPGSNHSGTSESRGLLQSMGFREQAGLQRSGHLFQRETAACAKRAGQRTPRW